MTKSHWSKDLGLDLGLLIGRHFLDSEDLHFGVWTDEQPRHWAELAKAQKNHSELILSHIPRGAQTILDVGGGAGNFAVKLLDAGYQVDVVTPSPFLADSARERMGDRGQVHCARFEDLPVALSYDVVLFSESFQYVPLEEGLDKAVQILKPDGHLLICDFFRRWHKGGSHREFGNPKLKPMKGGHHWPEFRAHLETLPLSPLEDVDITHAAGRTLDVIGDAIRAVVIPSRHLLEQALEEKFPRLKKVLFWKMRKRIEKVEHRYLNPARFTAEAFVATHFYRLMLFQKHDGPR